MKDSLDRLLNIIVSDSALHARWLNTFSYLEFIGFRKIVKSQKSDQLTSEILSHALEEGRHALRLKRLAIKIGGPKFNCYNKTTLLGEEKAKEYF